MIKLLDLLRERDKEKEPEILHLPAMVDQPDDELIHKRFKTTDLEMGDDGVMTSKVEYLPKFDQIKRDLQRFRTTFQPFKHHLNPNISHEAKALNTLLTKAAQMVFNLDKMIELERKNKL